MIVLDYPPHVGGRGDYVWEVSRRLSSRHDVTVVTTAFSLPEGVTREDGVTVARFKGGPYLFLAKALYYLASSPRFDLYHGHGMLGGVAAKLASVLKGAGSILHLHGASTLSFQRNSPRHVLASMVMGLGYDCVMSVDRETALEVPRRSKRQKSVVVTSGVDLKEFRSLKGFKKDKNSFLSVARLEPQKNPLLLLEACEILQKRKSKARVLICGSGSLEGKMAEFIAAKGLRNVEMVRFVPQTEVNKRYNESGFFLMPSSFEGMPLVVLEAFAAGTPVIVSDIPQLKSLVLESKAGLVFRQGDAADLARVMERASKMPLKEFNSLKGNGFKLAKKYSWERVVEDMERAYKDALKA